VLRVATVRDASARYYLEDLGEELGRVAPAHATSAGWWVGCSARPLGLTGPVAADALSALLEGRRPTGGRPLLRTARTVVAYDLTFAVAKGVSVLLGLGRPEARDAVVLAHREAVDRAVGYLERRAVAVRRGSDEDRVVLGADGLVGAAFTHCLSRSGDPHLHTHLVVANLAHGADARWSALDGRGLFAHARAAGALHDAHLRAALTERLGVGWCRRPGRGWDLAGSDEMLLAAFSGRRAEIAEAMARHGDRSAAARHVAWAATRPPKPAGVTARELAADWSRRARVAGATPALGAPMREAGLDESGFAAEIAACPPSGVRRRDVVAAWAGSAVRADAVDLERAVDHWVPGRAGRGVAEPACPPAAVVPAGHLLRALGERPAEAVGQPVWRTAAAAIDRYRTRWGVSGPDALERPAAIGGLPPRQLADHLEARRTVREAVLRLGGRSAAVLEREAVAIAR
jgi:conjugative relaxase-like TrwC/TraI family protein